MILTRIIILIIIIIIRVPVFLARMPQPGDPQQPYRNPCTWVTQGALVVRIGLGVC